MPRGHFNPDGGSLGDAPEDILPRDIKFYEQEGRAIFAMRDKEGKPMADRMAYLTFPLFLKHGIKLPEHITEIHLSDQSLEPSLITEEKRKFARFIRKCKLAIERIAEEENI